MADRIAIIGTGIAGMAAAHLLHARADLTIYERNAWIGGHTNTVMVPESSHLVPVDTGFMVYNEVTYPNLVRLFAQLDVPVKKTSMSFSVQHVPTGLEWNGSSLNHLFAQRKNLFRPRYYRFLLDVNRFNRDAVAVLDSPTDRSLTLADYVARERFGDDFVQHYLIPMSSAVWSTPADAMLRFPAVPLILFFRNHGFLGLHTQHQWWTVDGGSVQYRDRLIAPFRDRIQTSDPVVSVDRSGGRPRVTTASGRSDVYEKVVLACHADEALNMLADATDDERRLLGPFRYQPNRATLHTDRSVMPRTPLAWASWNYRVDTGVDGGPRASTIYWMNSLQNVSKSRDYFVSINDPGRVDPATVIATIDYTHPVFSVEAMEAQGQLDRLNGSGRTYYCGSYFGYGFHEDALTSAVTMVRRMTGEAVW